MKRSFEGTVRGSTIELTEDAGLPPGQPVRVTLEPTNGAADEVGQAANSNVPARRLGTLKGSVLYIAPDFDAPLEEFKDYMA